MNQDLKEFFSKIYKNKHTLLKGLIFNDILSKATKTSGYISEREL